MAGVPQSQGLSVDVTECWFSPAPVVWPSKAGP